MEAGEEGRRERKRGGGGDGSEEKKKRFLFYPPPLHKLTHTHTPLCPGLAASGKPSPISEDPQTFSNVNKGVKEE